MTDSEKTIANDEALISLLRDYPVEEPGADFYDKALARAARASVRRQRNRWLLTGFGGAVAAGIVAWMIGGVMLSSPTPVAPEMPGVTIALEAPREVSFVFASAQPLENATLTIELPDGVELAGFPGQRAISWETSLDAGKNHLPLTLIATRATDGIVVARLEHDTRSKTFRLRVTTKQPDQWNGAPQGA
jgi:hypothetical protein